MKNVITQDPTFVEKLHDAAFFSGNPKDAAIVKAFVSQAGKKKEEQAARIALEWLKDASFPIACAKAIDQVNKK